MSESDNILNELKDLSLVVANVARVNVFTVDDEYFNTISAELKARITADNFYAHQNAFTVPEGYFKNLSDSILNKIKEDGEETAAEEIQHISPVIAAIGNSNVFTVPDKYFEQDLSRMAAKYNATPVKISKVRTLFRYAAAAVITGLLGLTLFNIVNKKEVVVTAQETAKNDTSQKIKNAMLQTGSFDEALQNINSNEIEQYLQQNGQDVNAALVASTTDDESKLPEAADYLLNENTLDEFLDKNNLKN